MVSVKWIDLLKQAISNTVFDPLSFAANLFTMHTFSYTNAFSVKWVKIDSDNAGQSLTMTLLIDFLFIARYMF